MATFSLLRRRGDRFILFNGIDLAKPRYKAT